MKERVADTAVGASWVLWGLSLTQVNELLTTISLLAAIFASVTAGIFYLRRRK